MNLWEREGLPPGEKGLVVPGGEGGAETAGESVKAGMQQLREAIASGQIRPITYDYKGGVYTFPEGSDLAEKYPNGVRFPDIGFPDLSPYAEEEVQIERNFC